MRKFLRNLFFGSLLKRIEELENNNIELNKDIEDIQEVVRLNSESLRDINSFINHIDVSVDIHQTEYSRSWACISIQGEKQDYVKFMDLGNRDAREIAEFLRRFERARNWKIDANPEVRDFIIKTIR